MLWRKELFGIRIHKNNHTITQQEFELLSIRLYTLEVIVYDVTQVAYEIM